MILAISGSGRKNRMIHTTLRLLTEGIDDEVEIVSLSGKKINGCTGCIGCAGDNICKQKDGWNAIGEKMTKADIIIFGAPNYYDSINALAHAALERTYAFYHREAFTLKGKKGIIVSTTLKESKNDPVERTIRRFMESNRMDIVGSLRVYGYAPCYTCGYGHDCAVGYVHECHGGLERIEKKHLPPEIEAQPVAIRQIAKTRRMIEAAVNQRRLDQKT